MRPVRTLVLIEPGRAGDAAVHQALTLARRTAMELTIVGIAPQAPGPRCGTSTLDYNAAIVAAVREDLARVRETLGGDGALPVCRLIVQGRDPALEQFAATGDFDLVLLPARGRRFGSAPASGRRTPRGHHPRGGPHRRPPPAAAHGGHATPPAIAHGGHPSATGPAQPNVKS